MQELKVWALNICLCLIGSAIVVFLVPKGNIEKPMKSLVAIFILTILLLPILENKITNINFENSNLFDFDIKSSDVNTQINIALAKQGEAAIRDLIDKQLTNISVEKSKINIITDIDEDNRIIIKDIKISVQPSDKRYEEKIKEEVKNLTGLEPIVIVVE